MAISVVLKPFTAFGEKFVPGDLVDTGAFRNESALTGSRYVRPATPEEYVEAVGLTSSFTQNVPRDVAASEDTDEDIDDVEDDDADFDEVDEEEDDEDEDEEDDEEEDDDAEATGTGAERREPEPEQPKRSVQPKPQPKSKSTGSDKSGAKSGGKPAAKSGVTKKAPGKKTSRRR